MMLNVAVIGCGTAGQAASVLLARAGHSVRVFEQAPEIRPVGAGLLVQPTGLEVLERLGVGERLRDLASPIRQLLGTTPTGRVAMRLRYADLHQGLAGLGLQRAAISAALLDVMRDAGVDLVTNTKIVSAEPDGTRARLTASHGPLPDVYDLVIAADGARSAMRESIGAPLVQRDREYTWGALWFIGDDHDGVFNATLRQVYRGAREMIGFLPSGRTSAVAPNRVSLFWSVRASEQHNGVPFDLSDWKAKVRSLTNLAEPLLNQVTDPDQVIFAPFRDVILRDDHTGPVVFIGDAAHAMSPQLGQGVNLALADAAQLADSLDRIDVDNLEAALIDYTRARRSTTRTYQFASRWLTPIFQSNWPLIGPMRDLTFPLACRFPPTRRHALRALAGELTGPLSSQPISTNS